MNSALLPEPEGGKGTGAGGAGAHHRKQSSSISFLHGFEDMGDLFLQSDAGPPPSSLQASFAPPIQPMPNPGPSAKAPAPVMVAEPKASSRKIAEGGTSKRVRRKCTIAGCQNRVVQGGLCISHGAARKKCKHPGCNKNVKKAGLCSAHGPARKRCDVENCEKVAVQGGRCIAHGAKKKLCSIEGCSKQAILTGMCKKHHDQANGVVTVRSKRSPPPTKQGPHLPALPHCVVIGDPAAGSTVVGDEVQKTTPGKQTRPSGGKKELANGTAKTEPHHKTGHTRGLSIFQEISPDAVQNWLSTDEVIAEGTNGGAMQAHPLR